MSCELCAVAGAVVGNELAYARYDSHSLAPGHMIVVPRRPVADFFEMTLAEQAAVLELLNRARRLVQAEHAPDGYNLGVMSGRRPGSRACMCTCISSRAMPAMWRIPRAACAACCGAD
jgi:diadenosine tetraphosphate (Ap4A) HIT family hydrolase